MNTGSMHQANTQAPLHNAHKPETTDIEFFSKFLMKQYCIIFIAAAAIVCARQADGMQITRKRKPTGKETRLVKKAKTQRVLPSFSPETIATYYEHISRAADHDELLPLLHSVAAYTVDSNTILGLIAQLKATPVATIRRVPASSNIIALRHTSEELLGKRTRMQRTAQNYCATIIEIRKAIPLLEQRLPTVMAVMVYEYMYPCILDCSMPADGNDHPASC